jgi:hypothetical protein
MRHALKRPVAAGAITLVVASSWTSSAALAGCTATALSASAGVFGPPSISATESSTAQALELIRQRRMQVAEACPTGFTRAGGICQPVAQVAAADTLPAAAAAPAPSATAPSAGGGAAAGPRTKAAPRPRAAAAAPAPRVADYGGSLKDAIAPPPGRLLGTWIEGFADWERHDDVRDDLPGGQEREMYTTGMLSGLDSTDVPRGIQLGVLSGYTYSQAKFSPYHSARAANDDGVIDPNALTFDQKQSVEGTSLGLYGSYFSNTGFSADLLYKLDLFDLTQSDSVAADTGCGNTILNHHGETSLTNHIVASNLYYRWSYSGGVWVEPSVGLRFTHTSVGGNGANIGLDDGDALRVQGGVRVGRYWFTPGGYLVTTAITGLLYSDVYVDGFALPGIGVAPGVGEVDEGKLRVMGIAQAKIDMLNGTSWYGQVEVRGGEDLIGVGGKVGLRVQW